MTLTAGFSGCYGAARRHRFHQFVAENRNRFKLLLNKAVP